MLMLALSCLQGRPMQAAAEELLALGPDGLQLTPGNVPTPDFEGWLTARGVVTCTHHGFTPRAYRTRVWADDGSLCVASDSVHPPKRHAPAAATWIDTARARPATVFETMHPGYCLGRGDELELAMEAGLSLAVDVSHLYIQLRQGVVGEPTWRRLREHDRIAEVHVSANAGRHDTHRPIAPGTFGLGWARERLRAGTRTILESYLHRLDAAQRREQIGILRQSP